MAEFHQPPTKPPKIPATVPLEKADRDKQEEYAAFAKMAHEAPAAPLPDLPAPEVEPTEAEAPAVPEFEIETEPDPAEPTPLEKQEFIRSILGSFDYSKTFNLFNSTAAVFTDRSVELTEAMYAQLEKDARGDASELKLLTDEEWAVWTDRYVLACTLRSAVGRKYAVPKPEELLKRARELMQLPRPLYVALMECSRTFDRHVEILTTRALDGNFYKTGGDASQ